MTCFIYSDGDRIIGRLHGLWLLRSVKHANWPNIKPKLTCSCSRCWKIDCWCSDCLAFSRWILAEVSASSFFFIFSSASFKSANSRSALSLPFAIVSFSFETDQMISSFSLSDPSAASLPFSAASLPFSAFLRSSHSSSCLQIGKQRLPH